MMRHVGSVRKLESCLEVTSGALQERLQHTQLKGQRTAAHDMVEHALRDRDRISLLPAPGRHVRGMLSDELSFLDAHTSPTIARLPGCSLNTHNFMRIPPRLILCYALKGTMKTPHGSLVWFGSQHQPCG